jgi:hypothetical protein
MGIIVLNVDDERLGTITPDGSAIWPLVDVFGKPYERINATMLRLDKPFFVVVPPDAQHRWESVQVAAPAKPAKAPKSEAE